MAKKNADEKETRGEDDNTDNVQPWAKQFDDDRDDSGNLSRVATRKKKRGNSIVIWVIWIALALIIIVPVTWYAWVSNQPSSGGDYSSSKITVNTSKKKATSKSASKASSSKAKTNSSSSKTSQATSSVKKREATSSSAAVSSSSVATSQASSSSTAASSSSTAETTYTVKAGDNLYRIAVNHGLTLDELLQLNGLSSGSTISAGETLRVK